MAVNVTVQDTPNPNARRFLVDKPVQDSGRGRFYTDVDSADNPLARRLLELDGVVSVMLLPTSVTVNKDNGANWDEVGVQARTAIEEHFADAG